MAQHLGVRQFLGYTPSFFLYVNRWTENEQPARYVRWLLDLPGGSRSSKRATEQDCCYCSGTVHFHSFACGGATGVIVTECSNCWTENSVICMLHQRSFYTIFIYNNTEKRYDDEHDGWLWRIPVLYIECLHNIYIYITRKNDTTMNVMAGCGG